MINFWKWVLWREDPDKPNYRVIELEAENNKFKDDLIESLRNQIQILTYQVELMKAAKKIEEIPVEVPETKPRISTSTQLAKFMEEASLIRKKEKENVKTS